MNQIFESAKIALASIWASKLRSFMTVLGNIVAVTSIIAVVSLIQGLNQSVKAAIEGQSGTDSFVIQRYPVARTDEDFERVRNNPMVSLADMRAIQRYGGDDIAAVMADNGATARITYRDKSIDNTSVTGLTSGYVNFSGYDAERGRLMTPAEVDSGRAVTVLGWQTADRLFGENIDPIDKIVNIEGVHFRIVGVSAKKGTVLGQSQDSFALMPLGRFNSLFGSRRSIELNVKVRDVSRLQAAQDEALVALRGSRRLKPKQPDNFGMFTSDTIIGIYNSATSGIFTILIGVVGLSLVVGGIVIMNIMLMVVTERTREIGLRKALGAKRRDIMSQMLTESVVLSMFGGVVGTILGTTIALIISKATPIPAAVEAWSIALGIGITALVGLFFGLYPASRAARLDPIEALRRE